MYIAECLYNTEQQLFRRLKQFCRNPGSARDANISSLVRLSCSIIVDDAAFHFLDIFRAIFLEEFENFLQTALTCIIIIIVLYYACHPIQLSIYIYGRVLICSCLLLLSSHEVLDASSICGSGDLFILCGEAVRNTSY